MSSKRLCYVLIGLIVLMLGGLIGGAYGANNLLQANSKQLIEARTKSSSLDQQQIQLTKAKADIIKYKSISEIAKSIVPQDKSQAETVREIVKIAGDNGVALGTITFPASTLGGTGAGAAPGGKADLSQLKPAPGLTGVYTLQIVVQSNQDAPVPFDRFTSFLAGLENNRRTALVSGIILQPDSKDPSKVGFTLNIDEYIKP